MMPPPSRNPLGAADASAVDFDIVVEAGDWPPHGELGALARAVLDAACAELALTAEPPAEVSLLFTDDAHIRDLNRQWRNKDKPTNVLSFPAMAVHPGIPLPPVLGDVVLALGTVRREAVLEDKSFEHHLSHLILHGFLHLIGYDHEDEQEAEEMESAERRILARLAIPDPYG
jgi:probable rRNA maturation factor